VQEKNAAKSLWHQQENNMRKKGRKKKRETSAFLNEKNRQQTKSAKARSHQRFFG